MIIKRSGGRSRSPLLAAGLLGCLFAAMAREPAIEKRIAGETICARESIAIFYTRRKNALAWFDADGLTADAAALVSAIAASTDDGLTPSDYHLTAIRKLQADPAVSRRDLDLLLTDAFLLLASHLAHGRVDPTSVESTWCLPPRTFDMPAILEAALANHTISATLERLEPAQEGYRALRAALAKLRETAARGGWTPLERHASSDRIAMRLGVPLPPDAATLDAAIRDFQRLHGLAVDGKCGRNTIAAMNVPVAERIRQIEVNMERWRWLPATLGERHAVINIPEFRMRVVDGGREAMSMNVVVGKDFQRTPVFSSSITQVVFSPYWNVPWSIARKELLPKAARDPSFLASQHIEVASGGRLRQTPGPWNSLGFIKFVLPNPYGVYLHDTPVRTLFAAPVRTFSHGCIRIEKPVDLAAYLLRGDPAWTLEQIITVSQRGTERIVAVQEPLPVHVLYWTAFVRDGELFFGRDVYRRDATLDGAMRRPPR